MFPFCLSVCLSATRDIHKRAPSFLPSFLPPFCLSLSNHSRLLPLFLSLSLPPFPSFPLYHSPSLPFILHCSINSLYTPLSFSHLLSSIFLLHLSLPAPSPASPPHSLTSPSSLSILLGLPHSTHSGKCPYGGRLTYDIMRLRTHIQIVF